MKFLIHKEVVLEHLQNLLGPTSTKQNFPILNSVLIESTTKKLKFTTTDLDITIIASQEAEVIEKGKTAIPMKRFLSIVRELPAGEITIETLKSNLSIKCGKIDFKINTLNAEEFPKIDEEKQTSLIKLNPVTLEEMIKMTSFCVGYEDVNYVLNGILFEIHKDTLTLVATDGKRLSYITRKLPSDQPDINEKLSFILPIKAVSELHKLIKEVDDLFLFVEENRVGFDFKNTQFIARPIEGEFPNYKQYIPKEAKEKLVVNRKGMLASLRRAAVLLTPDYQGVKLETKKDTVIISKTTPQLGEVKESVDVHYKGAALTIGFNPTYLMDVLKNLEDEEVGFEFFGSEKPALLRKEDYVYLVLPMKI